jgi:hypothetical protein
MAENEEIFQSLIAAAEAKLEEIRTKAEVQIAKIRGAADEESAKLEGYIQGVRDAVRLNGEFNTPQLPAPAQDAAPARKRGRPKKIKVEAKAKAEPKKRGRKPRAKKAEVTFRAGSVPDRLRALILQSGKPMPLQTAIKRLSRGGKDVSLQSVENRISALARQSNTFVRSGRRIYGLLELGHPAA